MDIDGIMLSEISQTEKDTYCMISILCGIENTKQVNKHNRIFGKVKINFLKIKKKRSESE